MARKGREVILVRTAGDTNWDGDPIEGEQLEYEVPGCDVLPKYSREAETIVTGLRVLCQDSKAEAIGADDSVFYDGVAWEVDGVPGIYRKQGRFKAAEIHLKRAGR